MHVYNARKITLCCKALKPVISICIATDAEMRYKKKKCCWSGKTDLESGNLLGEEAAGKGHSENYIRET